MRLQYLQEPIRESRRIENLCKQDEAFSGVFVARHFQHRVTQFRIAAERLRAVDQPEIQALLLRAQIRHQFGVEAFRVVDEISGMHFEEVGQKQPRVIGQMPAAPILDLR